MVIAVGALVSQDASAESSLTLAAIFSDKMVIQADKPVAIWGRAKPGAEVVVSLGEQSAQGDADEAGDWRVELPAGPAGGPWDMVVHAKPEKLIVRDVLRGEVWFCSGQSNMMWAFHALPNYADVVRKANDPQLRYFNVRSRPSAEKLEGLQGEWREISPANMPSCSAVAYFFGARIREATGSPVGLIVSAVGGTPIESWTDLETMKENAAFESSLDRFAQAMTDFPARQKEFENAVADWEIKVKEAEANGETRPRRPRPPLGDNHPNAPANLYNGMIHPLVNYDIRGILWYQGEANTGIDPVIYAEQFQAMIKSWRTIRDEPDLPFYFVQLPNFRVGLKALAVLRESQRKALQLPNTGMAVTIDVGDVADIHPENKLDVGERLARWALKNEYDQDIIPSGPLVQNAGMQDGNVIVTFDHADGLKTSNGEAPETFEVAGADRKFVPVSATIESDTIKIQPPENLTIAAVRYGWDSSPPVNLVNSEDLPASPFTIEVKPE